MTLFYSSIIVANSLLFLSFIYGIYSKQLWSIKQVRLHITYLGFILGIEVFTKTLIYLFEINNTQLVYPFYISGEFFILLKLFFAELKIVKKYQVVIIFFTIFIFLESSFLWYTNGDASTGYGKIISHLSIICIVAYLLIKSLKELETNNPFLIIYAALFFYYAISLSLFLIMNQLTKTNIFIWTMNNLFSSILYGSSIYTFYQLKKSQ